MMASRVSRGRLRPQMLSVIQQVLRRLQEEYNDVDVEIVDDSDYAPSSAADDDEDEDKASLAEALTEKVVFKKHQHAGDCAICLEEMRFRQHGHKLVCGHHFHRKCITQWLDRDRELRCPTCRTPSVKATARVARRSQRLTPS